VFLKRHTKCFEVTLWKVRLVHIINFAHNFALVPYIRDTTFIQQRLNLVRSGSDGVREVCRYGGLVVASHALVHAEHIRLPVYWKRPEVILGDTGDFVRAEACAEHDAGCEFALAVVVGVEELSLFGAVEPASVAVFLRVGF